MIAMRRKNRETVIVMSVIKRKNREIVIVKLVEENIHTKKNARKMRDFYIVVITITKNVTKWFIIMKKLKIKII